MPTRPAVRRRRFRRHEASCPCGWALVYASKSAAQHMLRHHLEDGHGGADD